MSDNAEKPTQPPQTEAPRKAPSDSSVGQQMAAPEREVMQHDSAIDESKEKRKALKLEVKEFSSSNKPAVTPVASEKKPVKPEDDSDVEKTGWDKFGDTLQKGFAMLERLYKQILEQFQNYGATGLSSMADILHKLKWEKAANFLEDMAKSDKAALRTARGSLNIQKPALKISLNDPDAAAKDYADYAKAMEEYDTKVETLGGFFTASRGYPNKVAFFRKVVEEFKKQDPDAKECSLDDLIKIAKDPTLVPPLNPNAPTQAPETPATALEGLPPNTSLLSERSVNVLVNGQKLGVRVSADGMMYVSKEKENFKYRIVASGTGDFLALSLTSAFMNPEGMLIGGGAKFSLNGGEKSVTYPIPKLIALNEVKTFLGSIVSNPTVNPQSGSEFRFERMYT